VELAFKYAGLELQWYGTGVEEKGMDKSSGKTLVEVDRAFFRHAEVEILHSNPAMAKEQAWLVSGSGLCRPC